MFTLERTNSGRVKIATRCFHKVYHSSTFADVKGNYDGDANAQGEHDGAATLETWIQMLTVIMGSSQVPLFSTHIV